MDAWPARCRTRRHPNRYVRGVHVLRRENSNRPCVTTLAKALPKLGACAVPGIRENATEAHPCGANPIDFVECDAPLGTIADRSRNLGSLAARSIVGPRLRKIETQTDWRRNIVARERQRNEALTVRLLTERATVLMRNPHRFGPLLR